jgi:hypothetical protein
MVKIDEGTLDECKAAQPDVSQILRLAREPVPLSRFLTGGYFDLEQHRCSSQHDHSYNNVRHQYGMFFHNGFQGFEADCV